MMRTHTCGALRPDSVDQHVELAGWVETVRDHGGVIFIDLRDREGLTQAIFDPSDSQEAWDVAQAVRPEYVIQVSGIVEARPSDMVNPRLKTGAIEVRCDRISVLNRSATPPFPLDDREAAKVSEELRMTYRYLDLRRPAMQKNLSLRHKILFATRAYLDEASFTEVETPILSKSTPEGARDYLVPSRVNPGCFFALPQAPQQYKQLLMVAGTDRYFQIARCFRDEDLRADRQPEFTQIDIEMSFITPEDIYSLIDGLIVRILQAAGKPAPELPLPRMSYAEAMGSYGSDKPDVRFGMKLKDVGSIFAQSDFKLFASTLEKGHVIKAFNAKGLGGIPRRIIDLWTEQAREFGLGGLAYIVVNPDGSWKSPIVKFFSEAEQKALAEAMDMQPGDLVLFAADEVHKANDALGRIRLLAGAEAGVIDPDALAFTWVTDFPLFERNDEGRISAMHHPFTAPHPEDLEKLESDPLAVTAQAYDIVLNGVELGGGSIRIHNPEVQARMFRALQIDDATIQHQFGHLIKALGFGAPPHGGIALGADRLVMLMVGGESIRDVMAFPKNQKAVDLMMQAPCTVDAKQLRDVFIRTELPPKAAE